MAPNNTTTGKGMSVEQGEFVKHYHLQQELADDLQKLVSKYSHKLSTAQFIGVMEIVKIELLTDNG